MIHIDKEGEYKNRLNAILENKTVITEIQFSCIPEDILPIIRLLSESPVVIKLCPREDCDESSFMDFLDLLPVYGILQSSYEIILEGSQKLPSQPMVDIDSDTEKSPAVIFSMDENTSLNGIDFSKVHYVYITDTLSGAKIQELIHFVDDYSIDIFLSCLVSEESAKCLIEEIDNTGADCSIMGFEHLMENTPYQNSFDKLIDRIEQLNDEISNHSSANINDVYRLLVEGYYWLYALSLKEGEIDKAKGYLPVSVITHHLIENKTSKDIKIFEFIKKAQTEKVETCTPSEKRERAIKGIARNLFPSLEGTTVKKSNDLRFFDKPCSSSPWEEKPETSIAQEDTSPLTPEPPKMKEEKDSTMLYCAENSHEINAMLFEALNAPENTTYYILLAPYLPRGEGESLQKDYPTIRGRKVFYGFEQSPNPDDFDKVLALLMQSDIRMQSCISDEMAVYFGVVIKYWKAYYHQDVFERVVQWKNCQNLAKSLKDIPYAKPFLARVQKELDLIIPSSKKIKIDDQDSPSCNPNLYRVFDNIKQFQKMYSAAFTEAYEGCYRFPEKPRGLLINFAEIKPEERREELLVTFTEKSGLIYTGNLDSGHAFFLNFETPEDTQMYLWLNFQRKNGPIPKVSEMYMKDNFQTIVIDDETIVIDDGTIVIDDGTLTKKRKSMEDSTSPGEVRKVAEGLLFKPPGFSF